jgi:hypothetical protein
LILSVSFSKENVPSTRMTCKNEKYLEPIIAASEQNQSSDMEAFVEETQFPPPMAVLASNEESSLEHPAVKNRLLRIQPSIL